MCQSHDSGIRSNGYWVTNPTVGAGGGAGSEVQVRSRAPTWGFDI